MQKSLCKEAYVRKPMQGSLCKEVYARKSMQESLCKEAKGLGMMPVNYKALNQTTCGFN